MYWLNNYQAVGRATKDAELKYADNGNAIATFSLALPQGKNADGTPKEPTYVDFVAYGEQAERAAKQIAKGGEVFVVNSKLSIRKFTDKATNQPRKSFEFVVNQFQLGYNANRTEEGHTAPSQGSAPAQAPRRQAAPLFDDDYDPGF